MENKTCFELVSHYDGYYDEMGHWQRTKFCFVDCGDRCTCKPPNNIWVIPKVKEKDNGKT